MPSTAQATTVSSTDDSKRNLEAAVHKLKLQWMIAKTDGEKRKISEEIRRLTGSASKK